MGCNVCSSASACQKGFAAVASGASLTGSETGKNETLTCSAGARVWAASHMSCQVVVSGLNLNLASLSPCVPDGRDRMAFRIRRYKQPTLDAPH